MAKLDDILGLGDLDTKELERIALGQALRRAAEGQPSSGATEAASPADHEKPTVMGNVEAALHAADNEKPTRIAVSTPNEMPTIQASQAVMKDIRAEALAALEAQGVDLRAPVQEHTMPLTPQAMRAAKEAVQGATAKAAPAPASAPAVAASAPAVVAPPAKTTMQIKAAPKRSSAGGKVVMALVGLVAIGAAAGAVVLGMRAQRAQQAQTAPQVAAQPVAKTDDAVTFSAVKGKPTDIAVVAQPEAKPAEAKPEPEAKPAEAKPEPEAKPPATAVAAVDPPPAVDPKKDPPKIAAALPPPSPPAKADPPPKADPPKKPAAVAKADPPPKADPPAAPPPPQPAKPSVDSLLQQQLNSAIP